MVLGVGWDVLASYLDQPERSISSRNCRTIRRDAIARGKRGSDAKSKRRRGDFGQDNGAERITAITVTDEC